MTSILPAIITSIGLFFDIIGAFLVATEVVQVFNGPVTVDNGCAGTWAGTTNIVPNPKYVAHEERKRKYMKFGLCFLCIGFFFQGIGTWLPYLDNYKTLNF